MTHGRIDYLQLPARDVDRSAAFYAAVFGWSVANGSFEAPGMIGQWTTERAPVAGAGPLVWIRADDLYPTLQRVLEAGGRVCERPHRDGAERWLVEVEDPAGNRIGVVVHVRAPRSQTLIAVRDVEASSRWYQRLLGLRSDHGGPHYERLLAGGELVLQLHHADVEHHHGRIGDPGGRRGAAVVRRRVRLRRRRRPRRRAGRTGRAGAAPQPARGRARAGAPRDLDQRPGRLHGGGRQPGRRGHRAEFGWRAFVG